MIILIGHVRTYRHRGRDTHGRDRKDSVVWDSGGDATEPDRANDVIYNGKKEI